MATESRLDPRNLVRRCRENETRKEKKAERKNENNKREFERVKKEEGQQMNERSRSSSLVQATSASVDVVPNNERRIWMPEAVQYFMERHGKGMKEELEKEWRRNGLRMMKKLRTKTENKNNEVNKE
uniref:Uncharacterized protein n=1 Tax=Syphacia muris TaxID=451379 RepID=A0A0N5B0L9_9BILA